MKEVSETVRKFFEEYEHNTNSSRAELFELQYGDVFMFAGPSGVQAIKRDDFLKVLPKRREFFKTIGLSSSKILRLEETRLDENYLMVRVYWEMHFEKDVGQSIMDEISATYVLYQQTDRLQIVFQLDHQDFTKRVEELGLVPRKD